MQITGFPRSCTTLLLLLIAGSCTNREVYSKAESSLSMGGKVRKCPFSAIRGMGRDLILVRHPMAVMTSKSHGRFPGEYVIGWNKRLNAPYPLKEHYKAIRGERVWRAEDLTRHPDDFQKLISMSYGLDFDRDWSTWPFGDVSSYWEKSLGKPRGITPCREWDGDERAELLDNSDLREAIEELGYECPAN